MKQFAEFDFEAFVPTGENPEPNVRILEYLTIGPFVLKTYGSFEYEHMYAREKLLLEDYLAFSGGEQAVTPELGKKERNIYYGPEYLAWKKGVIKWDRLRFDPEGEDCEDALFATEQRNAVYYAAFYVNCDAPKKAVISYWNSGSSLYLNGELVDFQPYGRLKGLTDIGHAAPVTFKAGRNLVLFKIRPGFIADAMDLSMIRCCIYPVVLECDGLFLTSPTKTKAYVGTKEEPRMIFPAYVFAEKDVKNAVLQADFGETKIPDLEKGTCTLIRIGVPSAEVSKTKDYEVTLKNGSRKASGTMYFGTFPYNGFDGEGYVFSDFHFDTTYHQEQRTYALGAFHLTKCILDHLEKDADFKATLSEIDYLHPYFSLYPQHRKTLKDGFTQGRIDPDCFYNQPNDLTSSGEAFVRNLIYGQIYHRDVMGRLCTLYAPSDVYGHFSQISQVCAKGGVKAMRWKKMMLGVDNLFRHVSPDGTVLLHDKWASRADAVRLGLKCCTEDGSAYSYFETYPRTGDTTWMKNTLSHAQFAIFGQMADKLVESDAELKAKGEEHRIDYCSRDITQHHSGTALTRTDFKEANRLCENLLATAEKFAGVAFFYGAKYPEEALDKAWRQLLTAQHHDSVTGTNNEISYVDLMIEYRECAELAADVVKRSSAYIASLIKADEKDRAVVIFNPVTKDVAGPCTFEIPKEFSGKAICLVDTKNQKHFVMVKGGKGLVYTGTIPAMGYALYRIEECSKVENIGGAGVGRTADTSAAEGVLRIANDTVIENEKLRLEVDPVHGGIKSLLDKSSGKEFIDQKAKCSANSIYAMREIHDRMETQHEIYTSGEKLNSDEFDAEIVSEKCELYEKLTVRNKLDTVATVIREIVLYRGADTVEFKTTIEDYQGQDDLFTVAFPVDIKGSQVMFDDRFAPHVSTRSKKYMSFQTHQCMSFSGCRILPTNQWFGVGPTVTAVLDQENSFNLGMTAIIRKNTKKLSDCSKDLLMALTKKAVPVTIYPDTEQKGGRKIIHFNEDVYMTDTRFVLAVAGDEDLYTKKLLSGLSCEYQKAISARIEKTGCAIVFLKDADNAYKKPVDVVLLVGKDEEKLAQEIESISAQLSGDYRLQLKDAVMTAACGLAENYGAELLNRGTIAASVEGKNTLNMMLFHTAAFYGNQGRATGGKELVPEDKTHVFTYAFYPHKDSYREAKTYEKAEQFNTPLFAVTAPTTREGACLNEEQFFVRSSENFEITAFKAGGYPLAALRKPNEGIVKRGFAVRGFETTGMAQETKVEFGFDVANAKMTNLLEEAAESFADRDSSGNRDAENESMLMPSKNTICYAANGYSIDTFTVEAKPQNATANSQDILGMEHEFTEPIFTRSWDHDMGAVSMGNLRFVATIDRKPIKEDQNVSILSINLANNSVLEDAAVELSIEASEGLKTDISRVTEVVPAGGYKQIPLTVTRDSENREGQVRLSYTFEGRQFADVFEFGYFNPEVTVAIQGETIVCTVKNPTDQYLQGSLYLCSSIETWGDLLMNGTSFGTVSPFAFNVSLAPGETKPFESKFTETTEEATTEKATTEMTDTETARNSFFKAYYVLAKLCCNGRVHFGYAAVHGPRHNIWTPELLEEIQKDGGSIGRLLWM